MFCSYNELLAAIKDEFNSIKPSSHSNMDHKHNKFINNMRKLISSYASIQNGLKRVQVEVSQLNEEKHTAAIHGFSQDE